MLIAQVSSDRPILRETVIIQQLGWQVNAPRLDSAPDWLGYDDCHQQVKNTSTLDYDQMAPSLTGMEH